MRIVGAILIALLFGLGALPLVFADLTADESPLMRIGIAIAVFLIAGFVVGRIARPRWILSGLVAWAAVLMGLVMLWVKITQGPTPPYWAAIIGLLFGAPILSLLGGLIARGTRREAPPPSE